MVRNFLRDFAFSHSADCYPFGLMINRKFFFDQVRAHLFDGRLSPQQVYGLTAILNTWEHLPAFKDDRWLAYMLATAHHETDRKMQPIEEYGKGRRMRYGQRVKYNGKPYTDTKAIFYGRGYVQLTWYDNYEKAGRKIGRDLVQEPTLALIPEVAARIMFEGMKYGWFTGKKLADYFNDKKEDWVNARRIINGLDKANLIAGYGQRYYAAISHTV